MAKLTATLEQLTKQEAAAKLTYNASKARLEDAKTTVQSNTSKNAVHDYLLRLRDSGRVRGMHDRLGNLGRIDDKYDVAISTACGSLDFIVVDTADAATECINYLKKSNVGRSSFLCLDKQEKKKYDKINTPEGVPRLFDLVQPKDDKFHQVFYNALRNTLVAKDMEQANRIAYGKERWRVVTLTGELIEMSGTMAGGGKRVARGGMSSKFQQETVSATEIQALEQDTAKCEQAWTAAVDKKQQAQQDLEQARTQVPRLEMELKKMELEIQSLAKLEPVLLQKIAALEQENVQSPQQKKRLKGLEAQMTSIEREYTTVTTRVEAIDAEIKALQDKILQVGGVKLRAQSAKVDSIRERISDLNGRAVKMQVQLTRTISDEKKLNDSMVKKTGEVETAATELKEHEEELKELKSSVKAASKSSETAKMEALRAVDDLETARQELDDLETSLEAFNAKEKEVKHEIKLLEQAQKELGKKIDDIQAQMKRLTLYSLDMDKEEETQEFPILASDQLADMDKHELSRRIESQKKKLKDAKPNLSVIAEYRKRRQDYLLRIKDLEGATLSLDQAKTKADDLRKKRLTEFMSGFTAISYKLKEMYQMITLGGNAELELVDSLDPFSEGIIFSVMPPRKSWKNISNLSGGEKTLSSLALVFALHHFKPTPIYVMDEIDAALDFRNVSIVANYIKERTQNAQFIIISLRNNMFELADRLVGIYKTHNQTKSVAISPNQMSMKKQ